MPPTLKPEDTNLPDGGFGPSPSQTVGPYFHQGLVLPEDQGGLGNRLFPAQTTGRIELRGRVLDADGESIPDALIEIWQANAAGQYGDPAGFGRSDTRNAGHEFVFQTVKPGRVSPDMAPHLQVWLGMRGLLTHLLTRVYFADEDNSGDVVLAAVPQARRSTLTAVREEDETGAVYRLDFQMGGPEETVFFFVPDATPVTP
ncbi:protocatechuate 3,4-dioxygenase subunit alpha [Deinococcus radiomollis]|uniref:protocatechuate 3,4-dioxygenase subunit alpha n=1 Tax=Deinococcus radiomollis TaxID=468916 RepID=UPI003891BC41